jgi:hypothetical protein
MGFIRGSLAFFVGIFVLIALIVGSILFTLSWSLNYDDVKQNIGPVVDSFLQEQAGLAQEVEQEIPTMLQYCTSNTEYVFTRQNYSFAIPCTTIAQGSTSIIGFVVNSLLEQIYYDEYTCGFWDCFKKGEFPVFLLSQKAKNYWATKFYIVLGIFLVLGVLLFLLMKKKSGFLITLGIMLAVAAIPVKNFDWFFSIFGDNVRTFAVVFFSKANSVFSIMLTVGIILILAGVVWKAISSDIVKKWLGKKEIKEIVKEEIKKEDAKKEAVKQDSKAKEKKKDLKK